MKTQDTGYQVLQILEYYLKKISTLERQLEDHLFDEN